jgi:hypothetical protein
MARRKTPGEAVRAKLALAERLVALRLELYGDRGRPELARQLGIPPRTWYNYEAGITVPAEIVLRLIVLTSVEAEWLLDGTGPKFRRLRPAPAETPSPRGTTVGALLRTALHLLESSESTRPRLEGTFGASETAHGIPATINVSPPFQDLNTVQRGRWSESSASDPGSRARPDRREA